MRQYAAEQVQGRLDGFSQALAHASEQPDEEAIHDLRVSIRRLSQCLRTFADLLPRAVVQRVRAKLRRIMDAAGDVRNRDIALQLLEAAQIEKSETLAQQLRQEREAAQQKLVEMLQRRQRKGAAQKWQAKLQLA